MTDSLRIRVQDGLAGLLGSALSTLRGARAPRIDGHPIVDHWSLGGVGPATVAFLADQIRERTPRRILECGPGVSTIAMARTLDLLGSDARIVSLEHDKRWASLVRRRLRAAGVRRRVDLLVGELRPIAELPNASAPEPPLPLRERMSAEGGQVRGSPDRQPVWYGRAHDACALGPFDFAFIDGPPATDGRPRRAPALPLLWDAIAPGAHIILDDGRRRGERACIAQWRERFGDALSFEFHDIEKGLWVMTKRALAPEQGAAGGRRPPTSAHQWSLATPPHDLPRAAHP